MKINNIVFVLICFQVIQQNESCILSQERCNLLVSITDYENNKSDNWKVECDIGGQYYPLSWNDSYVRTLVNSQKVVSGKSELNLDGLKIENGEILEATENKIFSTIQNRRDLSTTGTRALLVVRVIALDSSTTSSMSQLSDKVFGIAGDIKNMKNQYEDCSYNQFNLVPAVNVEQGVVNGVMEISIAQNVKNTKSYDVQNAVTAAIGGGKPWYADHVMYCLPPGTSGGWIAYAYTNSWMSVYNDKWCTYLSTQMHELGHNRK